jgi:TRAP-type uncharacterized transport system substrate-binding protein
MIGKSTDAVIVIASHPINALMSISGLALFTTASAMLSATRASILPPLLDLSNFRFFAGSIEIHQAEGIGKRLPPYDSEDVVAGAFGGIPPKPDDKITTLKYPIYIMARKTLSADKVAVFARLLYQNRQSLAYQLPGTVAVALDHKDAAVLVHPCAAGFRGSVLHNYFHRKNEQY